MKPNWNCIKCHSTGQERKNKKNINKNCTSVYTVEIVQINFKIHAYFPEFIGEGG